MNNNTVIVYGPQGCGKTRNAAALAKHYGVAQVLEAEDYNPVRRVQWNTNDALILTNDAGKAREWRETFGARVVSFDDAMREMGATIGDQSTTG